MKRLFSIVLAGALMAPSLPAVRAEEGPQISASSAVLMDGDRGRVLYDDTPTAVFAHYAELEKIGLAAPQVTYVMDGLTKAGFAVRTDVTTISEARDGILRAMQDTTG